MTVAAPLTRPRPAADARPTAEQLAGLKNPFPMLIERYQRNPVGLVRDIFGAEPDPWQFTALMALARGHRRLSIRSGHGVGKAVAVDTNVLTWDRGWRAAGDIRVGDHLVAVDGTPTRVVKVFPQGLRQLYRVTLDDGASVLVDAEHLWLTRSRSERKHGHLGKVRTTREIADSLTFPNGVRDGLNHQLPALLPIACPARELPMNPWLLGAWLGDGRSAGGVSGIPREKALLFEAAGAHTALLDNGYYRASWHAQPALAAFGLLKCRAWEKSIPEDYLRGSIAQRTALLQGLLDTDGTVGRRNGNLSFCTTAAGLRDGIIDLVRGLGGVTRCSPPRHKTYSHNGERRRGRACWIISIALPPEIVPFRHPGKLARWRPSLHHNRTRTLRRHIASVTAEKIGEAVCFRVDHPEHLFVVEGHIVTHNSAFLAWVALWFGLTRFPFKVVITAPSAPQLYDALWAELVSWYHKLPAAWQMLLSATSDRIELRSRPEDGFITARTSRADQPEALQGVHSKHVLLLADEASGVPEPVFEAAGSSMSTPGAITILTGNPTRATGFFWRTHTLERDRWFPMRVSCQESKRVDPAFIAEIAHRHGIESNAYRVRVLGEFPLSDGDTMIGARLVESAMERVVEWNPYDPEIWGVDVARFGTDRSVLIKRRVNVVRDPPRRWSGLDTMQLTGQIHHEWNATAPDQRPRMIVVDSIGIGAGVEDRLRELGVPTVGVNVAESPSEEARYMRLRDELWQRCADWVATLRVALPLDEQLRDDLVGPRYRYTSEDKLKVESKNEMRSRGVPSPDSADALCLTFAQGAISALAMQQSRWGQPLRRLIRGQV